MGILFDPFSSEWRADPYPTYRALRDEAPVYWSEGAQAFCVSRYEDVLAVLKDGETYSSRAMFTQLMNGGEEGMQPLTWKLVKFVVAIAVRTRLSPAEFITARNLIAEDGESHAQMRGVVNRGFTPRAIEAWEQRAREIVAECLAGARAGAAFDVIGDLAIPLPLTIIAEMLGVEPERHADFKRWSDLVIEGASGAGRRDPHAPKYRSAFIELINYLKGVAHDRRRNPRGDLVSVVVAEQDGKTGLTDREVIQFCMLLLVAGNETTTNLIGNCVNALLEHPEALARACGDPTCVPALLEETLRFDAPIQLVFRNTTRDTDLAGVKLPAGATVIPLIGSANRDERRFPDPDRFDPARGAQGHVGFGFGEHFCLGASLARLEARAALEGLLPVLRDRVCAEHDPPLVDSFLVRGREHLRVARA